MEYRTLAGNRILHRVFLGLLLSYMGLMAFSSLVKPLRPAVLDGPVRGVTQFLDDFGVKSGIEVFKGAHLDYRERALCITVVGHTRLGTHRVLYDRPDDCDAPSFRWRADRFNQAIQNIVIKASFQRDPTQILSFLSDYYCHSGQVSNDDVEAVSILWRHIRQNEIGSIREKVNVLLHWNCAGAKPLPGPWPDARRLLQEVR